MSRPIDLETIKLKTSSQSHNLVLSNLLFCADCGLETRRMLQTGSGNRLRSRLGFAIKESWVKRLNSTWVALLLGDSASGVIPLFLVAYVL